MKERRHIRALVKETEDDYKLLILYQTHIGYNFAEEITFDEDGNPNNRGTFPVDVRERVAAGEIVNSLRFDGGSPDFSVDTNGWILYVLGNDKMANERPISIPKKYYPEVRALIDEYNEYFKEEEK